MFYIYKIYIYSFFKLTLLMLLVSSLDVFDCCGLELGGEGASSDPDRGDSRMKDSGVVFLREAEVLLPARARGHTGSLPETRQTHPWPRVKRTERRQIKRQRRWFQQEFGELQDMACFVDRH